MKKRLDFLSSCFFVWFGLVWFDLVLHVFNKLYEISLYFFSLFLVAGIIMSIVISVIDG